ncbi:MAG TPA: L-histidine N(alpha)-methyltransferase [Flavipsychrobacter sp.]|nr:L-histidine N(alpha)-methyltransferase [Flavipsychrobacter sp.]
MNQFFQDVWRGLNATPKYLESKYFYDEKGDKLFQEIMECPEYYLTRCELEIFSKQTCHLADSILHSIKDFDVVELGAGDATKSFYLLQHLLEKGLDFTYYPIDISSNVISNLHKQLPQRLPGLQIHGLNGEYFNMLEEVKSISNRNKVVLFLGSSIGNIPFEQTTGFLNCLKEHLIPGDLMLIGFDLKKDAATILAAYNDKGGITREFNLNLLRRINQELDADFDPDLFEHCPVYDEATGACKSYLKSIKQQRVRIGEVGWVHFMEGETIFMEISQKYTVEQIDKLAADAGFKPVKYFYDSQNRFLDAIWQLENNG